MDRRRALLRFGGWVGIALWGGAHGQPQGKWRIGFLAPIRRPASLKSHRYSGFLQGLREAGYVEGRNIVIEWRYADDDPNRVPLLAAELVKANVDLLVAVGTIAARAAQQATASIPIVMLGVGDPVGAGVAKSLARPGGNATGVSLMNPDLSGKWLEIARTIVPRLVRAALLVNPTNPAFRPQLEALRNAGQAAGVSVTPIEAASPEQIDEGFARAVQARAEGVFVQNDGMFSEASPQIAQAALRTRLPTFTGRHEFVDSGCLASYGSDLTEMYRRGASYVDRILRGAKPGDMPIEQPTSYELVLNLKTASALGIAVPKALVLRADRVIE